MSKDNQSETISDDSEMTFEAFVYSLATQALMQLGEMPAPEGINIPKDVGAAKQTVDLLKILKEKTRGNLNSQEEHLLTDMLHNLRLNILKHS